MIDKDIFEELFVLEMANNHLGSLERGLKIVSEFAQVVRFNNVRATIKLQFRMSTPSSTKILSNARTSVTSRKHSIPASVTTVRNSGQGDSPGRLYCNGYSF